MKQLYFLLIAALITTITFAPDEVGTVALALFITLVTVSFQAVRASLANPVNSLHSE
jgi:hypothetical protein